MKTLKNDQVDLFKFETIIDGLDLAILQKRVQIYQVARAKNPRRWSKNTRKWEQITEVHLNPTKEKRQAMQTAVNAAA